MRGEAVSLTRTQFALLACFVRHPGRLLTHRAIVTEVWGDPDAAAADNLRVQISQLRRRIEEDPRHPALIVTEPGLGYRFLAGRSDAFRSNAPADEPIAGCVEECHSRARSLLVADLVTTLDVFELTIHVLFEVRKQMFVNNEITDRGLLPQVLGEGAEEVTMDERTVWARSSRAPSRTPPALHPRASAVTHPAVVLVRRARRSRLSPPCCATRDPRLARGARRRPRRS